MSQKVVKKSFSNLLEEFLLNRSSIGRSLNFAYLTPLAIHTIMHTTHPIARAINNLTIYFYDFAFNQAIKWS